MIRAAAGHGRRLPPGTVPAPGRLRTSGRRLRTSGGGYALRAAVTHLRAAATHLRAATRGGRPRGYLQGGPVGFTEAVTEAFRNIFNYEGRASRSAYWWVVLAELIGWVGVVILAVLFAVAHLGILSILLYLAAAVFAFLLSLSLTVRRLHDQDKSGFWYFIAFVPLIGGIWLFVLTLLEGTPGPNRFG